MDGPQPIIYGPGLLSPTSPKRKLLLLTYLAPGDTMMLTATVRDLHKAYPGQFITDVDTTAMQIWDNNSYITKLRWHKVSANKEPDKDGVVIKEFGIKIIKDDPEIEVVHCEYHRDNAASISHCNTGAYHFVHAYTHDLEQKLGLNIPVTEFKGDIHLSSKERSWMSRLEEEGVKDNFWIIFAGGKFDMTTKWWNPEYYQKVVDHFKGKILFVQCGESGHWHPKLKNVFDLIGKTDTRQLIRLVYHADGVLCPITFGMHLAAAVPVRHKDCLDRVKAKNRACVVVAGGREPAHWEQYSHHQYVSASGTMLCCDQGGCWHSRCQVVGDKDPKDRPEALCCNPVKITPSLSIPQCMSLITPEMVIERIEMYYKGGAFKYNG